MIKQFPLLPELADHFCTMNNLAIMICRMLAVEHGLLYAESKAERLKGMSPGDVIFWASHALDGTNQANLADALDISMDDFQAAGRVLKLVNNL